MAGYPKYFQHQFYLKYSLNFASHINKYIKPD